MLSRKYYQVFAKILGETQASEETIKLIEVFFWHDNPRFDSSRFYKAIAEAKEEIAA